MTLLHVLYLALLPLSIELGIEVFRTRVLNRNDKHFLTAGVRLVIMCWGAFTYPDVPWWKILFVMFTLHYLVFNYVFNRYALETHWSYLGNNWLDRLQKKADPYLLLGIKVGLFILSILLLLKYI
jgi:hypothetical protein